MRQLHASGLGIKRIAAAVGRSTDTISKHLLRRCKAKPARVGLKVCITDSNYKRIFKGYKRLLKNAHGKEVTVEMVKKGRRRDELQAPSSSPHNLPCAAWQACFY